MSPCHYRQFLFYSHPRSQTVKEKIKVKNSEERNPRSSFSCSWRQPDHIWFIMYIVHCSSSRILLHIHQCLFAYSASSSLVFSIAEAVIFRINKHWWAMLV